MDTAENIAILREQVAQAKQQADELKAVRDAKEAEITELEKWHVQVDERGNQVMEQRGESRLPKIRRNATPETIRYAYDEWNSLKASYKEAGGRLSALRSALAEAEKQREQVAVEQLERELQARIDHDAELYADIEARTVELRAVMARWNDNIDAKFALRAQIREQGVHCTEVGAAGKADSRWGAWITADFADDAAAARQFGLLAQGQGYLNPLPSAFTHALRQVGEEHNRAESTRKATEQPKAGMRRATLA